MQARKQIPQVTGEYVFKLFFNLYLCVLSRKHRVSGPRPGVCFKAILNEHIGLFIIGYLSPLPTRPEARALASRNCRLRHCP